MIGTLLDLIGTAIQALRGLSGVVVQANGLQHTEPNFWAMFSMAIWTGLRVGELLVMQWQYLDLEQGAYSVERNFDQRRNLTTPKTKTSNNTIQLSSYVCEILEKHRAEQAAFRLRLPEWVDMDLIFPSRAERKDKAPSKPYAYSTIHSAIARAAQIAGIGPVRPHDLRHTCASLLISQNVNIKQISRQMRHANTSITWDTCGHLYPEDQTAVAEAMDKLFEVGN